MRSVLRPSIILSVLILTSASLYKIGLLNEAPSDFPPIYSADQPPSAARAQLEDLKESFPGSIVFDSNRSGSFGIYRMEVDGTDVTEVIDSPQTHEMYPEISPKHNQIAYSDVHDLSRFSNADLWSYDLITGKNTLLAKNAKFPSFAKSGDEIYFVRKERKIFKINLQTGQEKKVFPLRKEDFGPALIVVPRVAPDGKKLVFASSHPSSWHVWLLDLETRELKILGRGCQPDFSPDGKSIIWVAGKKMKERTGIVSYDLQTQQLTILHDAAAPRGHEYFPNIDLHGHYLLFSAASPKFHDHNHSDYQIFIKDLKKSEPYRITFDGYNNRWPRVLLDTLPTSAS